MERHPQGLKEGSRNSLLGLSYRMEQGLRRLVAHPCIQMWWAAVGNGTCAENESGLLRKTNIGSCECVQVHATHAASLPSSAARSQFESTAQASHTVGHSIISDSTFTDEKRSHKELCAKWHANKEELKKSLPSLTNYLVNYKPLWRAPTVDGLSDYTVHLSPLSAA